MRHILIQTSPLNEPQFDQLLLGLMKNVDDGFIRTQEQDGLTLFDYTKACVYERAWNKYTKVSRGLVLDTKNKKIIALPYSKFFNHALENDTYGDPVGNWRDAQISWKEDGSLGIVYHHDDKWHVNTRGSFNSDQAIWAEKWLHENVKTTRLCKSFTYLCEIIYNENQIVVRNNFEGLVMTGIYDRDDGLFMDPREPTIRKDLMSKGWLVSERPIQTSEQELLEFCKTSDKNIEGFVVYFPDNGTRVKIKGDEYCRIHKILAHHSPLTVWETLRDQGLEAMPDYKKEIPEEFWDETDEWVEYFHKKALNLVIDIEFSYQEYKNLSNKDLGIAISKQNIPYKDWFFALRKDPDLFKMGSKTRKKAFETFRPKGNLLPN